MNDVERLKAVMRLADELRACFPVQMPGVRITVPTASSVSLALSSDPDHGIRVYPSQYGAPADHKILDVTLAQIVDAWIETRVKKS